MNISAPIVKAEINLPHLVDTMHLDHYLDKAIGFRAAIKTIKVEYAVLNDEQHDALYEMCKNEIFNNQPFVQKVVPRSKRISQKSIAIEFKDPYK